MLQLVELREFIQKSFEAMMATCSNCGTMILFGGVKEQNFRYCNAQCQQQSEYARAAFAQIPEELVQDQAKQVHQSACPKCQGPGPVDVHISHTIWSAIVLTSWNSTPEVCCRSCGVKSKMFAVVTCGLLGWWGFPWGIVVTPIQMLRNIFGLINGPNTSQPSPALADMIRNNLAAEIIARAK